MAFDATAVNVNVNINNVGVKGRKGVSAEQVGEAVGSAVRQATAGKNEQASPTGSARGEGGLQQVARGYATMYQGAVDAYVGAARVCWSLVSDALGARSAKKPTRTVR